jgi:hypothetical protein
MHVIYFVVAVSFLVGSVSWMASILSLCINGRKVRLREGEGGLHLLSENVSNCSQRTQSESGLQYAPSSSTSGETRVRGTETAGTVRYNFSSPEESGSWALRDLLFTLDADFPR